MKRYVYINDHDLTQDLYCDNRISNTKYTILNFLPKNLWEQFRTSFVDDRLYHLLRNVETRKNLRLSLICEKSIFCRFMNQYFLLIACLQLWSLITPVNPASTWGPLIFIFAVSATKEAWDDYNRYLSDKQANEKEVWVVKRGIKTHIQAQEIRVGDIVWLRENDEVPCDLVLIGSSDLQGSCYIEGVIECPSPDKDIRRFDANMRLFPPFIDNDLCPLTINNTLLQSCYLRNTEWACGVAVYTGSINTKSYLIPSLCNETKLGMSRGIPEPKLTAMDAMIDKLTGAIFLFQIVVVIVLGIAGNVWKDSEARKQWYVLYPNEGPWYELLVIPLRFELLCSIMIPISIKVSLDLVKSLYAKFIDWDKEMYDQQTGTPSHATNTAISEDLGQVEYILTDKTGTLTENKMIFRRCCIHGIFYGNESGDALTDVELLNAVDTHNPDVVKFLTVMAVCNTVIPIKSKSGAILYKAQSQDEDALVNAAAQLHMLLANKSGNVLEVNFNGLIWKYEVLDILEFTSDRKRMSVVVKDFQNDKIFLLSKGADESILPCALSGQQVRTFTAAVDQYAQLGLRTLCLAWRELREEEYHEWSLMFKEANSSLVDREWKLAEVCQRLEHDLEILGVSAIEDRLQDGVPETIETLRNAGINFWMLTGDKQTTAIQIALLCNFISPEPKGQLLSIDGKTEDEVFRSLERVLLTMRITSSEPQLVELLKSCDYRTLAIGDGGNDVRMIQQADIGVGISGREGMQAARAADYSIGSISGTSLFNSVSLMAYNVFYTSIPVLVSVLDKDLSEKTVVQNPQILFYCQAGRLLNPSTFAGWFGRSLFHTGTAVSLRQVLHVDHVLGNEETVKGLAQRGSKRSDTVDLGPANSARPRAFTHGTGQPEDRSSYMLISRLKWGTTFRALGVHHLPLQQRRPADQIYEGLVHPIQQAQSGGYIDSFLTNFEKAVVVFLISIHVYAFEKSEMEELAMVALSGCIWLQAFVVTMETNSFTVLQHLAIWGNLTAFYIINGIVSTLPSSGMYTIMFRLCRQPSYWVTIFLTVVVGMGPVLALKYFRYTYRSSAINILQQAERSGGPILSLETVEPLSRPTDKDLVPLSITQARNRNSVYEPLLSDSLTATRRSLGGSAVPLDFFQSGQSRLSSNYSRNYKNN
ncbi:hypothetical protein IFM89_019555 [Coptis chinensis]|uniref:P-type phospholipid transporter n=1 Tax=Coptis chinensis TaxID=261450 RepID=A0A835I2A4_9MAGN|nr:hypothetical protein IFM89_019555 [Coptis chinensis]